MAASSPRITGYRHWDISPEEARTLRARAWAYVFACFERHRGKEGGSTTNRPRRPEGDRHDRDAGRIISE
jgi:hypothetical protein